MHDVNSLAAQSARAAATETHVRPTGKVAVDVRPTKPASGGHESGKVLPSAMSPENAARRQRVVAESRESLDKAVAHLNEYVQSIQRDLRFYVDDASGRSVVTVLDQNTREVVRQIPSDVALRLARNLKAHVEQAQPALSAGIGLIDTRI